MLLRLPSIICLLWALGAGNQAQAQAAAQNWEALYEAGVAAEDDADYKKAEALLEQACELAQSELGPEPEATACLKLGQTFAVQSDYIRAKGTLSSLADRLTAKKSPPHLVPVLFDLADVQSAIGRHDLALQGLRNAAELLPLLDAPDRVRGTARLGSIYLAVEDETGGMSLMQLAQSELLRSGGLNDASTVTVFEELGYSLSIFKQTKEAAKLLEPVAKAIDRRVTSFAELPRDLQDAYIGVFEQLADSYGRKKKIAKPFREQADQWRQLQPKRTPGNDGVHRIGEDEDLTSPQLLSKVKPAYTEGARSARAMGTALLEVEIWPDGKAHHIRTKHYLPYGLTWRAIYAVREWRFQPSTRNGRPVKVFATIEINFRLI